MPVPRMAAVAINVKGQNLLRLDHARRDALPPRDAAMWEVAGVDPQARPFGRLTYLVPRDRDGLRPLTLREVPQADVPNYSATRPYCLGIDDTWPFFGALVDKSGGSPITSLLAETRLACLDRCAQRGEPFSLNAVLSFFTEELLPGAHARPATFSAFAASTVRATYQRLQALPGLFGGLIDRDGAGYGLDALDHLQPFDLVIIDVERLLAAPSDPDIADLMLQMVVGTALRRLNESLTRRVAAVDRVVFFCDELTSLAPSDGRSGVGPYLSHIVRTTRDRGLILFGACQFRTALPPTLARAPAMHLYFRTSADELQGAAYASLDEEVRARLLALEPGEALLRAPSLRAPIFVRFPRPLVDDGSEGQSRDPEQPLPSATVVEREDHP